jgi:Cytochrome c oxidase subunit Vb
MFQAAIRAAVRPSFGIARNALRKPTSVRAFSATQRANSGPPPPQLFGAGGKPGEVPTDIEQATGLERLQLLGDLEGINVFDQEALDASRVGTKSDPIKVLSYVRSEVVRIRKPDSEVPCLTGRRAYGWLHWVPRRLPRCSLVHVEEGQAGSLHGVRFRYGACFVRDAFLTDWLVSCSLCS